MKLLATTIISLSLLASASSQASGQTNRAGVASGAGAATSASVQDAKTIKITRSSSQPPQMREVENFTGSVGVEPLLEATAPSRLAGARVTFAPGARTAWHSHPLGQTLIVTSGCGWVQSEGGPKVEIRPGDVVWCRANERHWHGAMLTTAMTHIAIQEQLDGKVVNWMEKVSDEQYEAE